MSSTGVRESNNNDRRIIKGLIQNEAQFIQSLRVFANTSTLSGLGSTEGEINNSPIDASGNYLSRLGDTMLGPLALAPPLDFTIEIDANNTIDIGPLNDNAQYTSNVQLDSIQPNGFVLDIIANAAFDGQLLVLRTFAPTVPFTISQGTLGNGGNIQTGDGNDLTVGDLQVVTLIFDEALRIGANTGGSWRILSSTTTGGGSTPPFSDAIVLIENSVDNTKLSKFSNALITPSTTRTYILPNSDTTLAGLAVLSQEWFGVNLFSGGATLRDSNFFIQDSVDITKQAKFDAGLITTGNVRTYILPNSDTTLAGLAVLSQEWFGVNTFPGILINGGQKIRSNNSTEIGFFVTNATSSIGTAGTNQVPVVPSLSSTVANLDAAFGSEIGCKGVYNTSAAFKNIAFKVLSGTWLVLACPDSGGTVISDFIT